MPRKTIKSLPSYKLSVLIEDETKKILDTVTDNYGMKYTKFVKYLLHTICAPSKDVQTAISGFLIQQVKNINNKIDGAGSFEKNDLLRQKEEYMEIYRLFNAGVEFPAITNQDMHIIQLKGEDLVMFPNDWLVLNQDQALSCSCAGVIECSGYPTFPHIIFFSETNDFSSKLLKKDILKKCREKWPELQPIIDGKMFYMGRSNSENDITYHFIKPKFIFFPLPDQDPNNEPPCGACIVRNNRN